MSKPLSPSVCRLVAGAILVLGGCGRQSAPSGEASASAPAGGAITLWSDSTELFMEHPALIVGRPEKFAVHLTDITDFAPLRSGRITLRFTPREGGTPLIVTQDAPRAPGIYGPAPAFTHAGVYDLTLLVDSPQARDSLMIPGLRVYASAADAPTDEESAAGGISFLKEQQWKTPGFATAFARDGSVGETLEVSGEVETTERGVAVVSAPISGLVDAASVAMTPAIGTRVARGRVLALITPALGEAGSAYAEARARLREAEEEHARAARLFAAEAVPQRRVHDAEIRLQAAREALSGLGGGRLTSEGRMAVEAPIGGVIVRRDLSPGNRVEAGASLFTIVDASVVWVRARVPAAQVPRVRAVRTASFRADGDTRVFSSRRVVSIGTVIDSFSRTLPVIAEFSNPAGALSVGAAGRVSLGTGRLTRGVVVPAGAVLDEDGRAIAYVQMDGERFEKRTLSTGGSDGTVTLILSGIRMGERVVTGAAYQVRLASLSTSVPAEGHEH